ncbi:hypothetical protein NDU88_001492 [Pleurodeles waltl]|uniref:Uncharacterized protein n=1 Tax=Pleurodeles waltl TaxID=8319 RepID=A0AAV7R7A3_PLEWA|nr:hypothetical protein NDU88_001492 [Pleurodeles waltl]
MDVWTRRRSPVGCHGASGESLCPRKRGPSKRVVTSLSWAIPRWGPQQGSRSWGLCGPDDAHRGCHGASGESLSQRKRGLSKRGSRRTVGRSHTWGHNKAADPGGCSCLLGPTAAHGGVPQGNVVKSFSPRGRGPRKTLGRIARMGGPTHAAGELVTSLGRNCCDSPDQRSRRHSRGGGAARQQRVGAQLAQGAGMEARPGRAVLR